ncbi:hypothetical protein VTJ49DRAFT_4321 [Mycothermus thermophilus]|uniref:EGF-like domain-containing protein n=1 Tax=Humicola insolens TaxID=85995 RepID=A0ABR3V5N7_HUMIN
MDPQFTGSIKRARERAAAGLPRPPLPPDEPQIARPSAPRQPGLGSSAGLPRGPRQPPPFPLQTKDGQIGVSISRPTPAPQWPLPGPIPVQDLPSNGPSRAPPPQRPPRPSRVPSILDSSKVQEQTPTVFRYRRDSNDQDMLPTEPPTNTSRPSTLSSVGSIPDFPLPMQMPPGPPRRSSLGPPPSARRGASSFYSNASFVSPIPEESPRSRSRASIASSTAIPDNWGAQSPGPSPDFPENDMIPEESVYGDEDIEESRLVRNASVGKRAKPTLVAASSGRPGDSDPRQGPFQGGTGYVDGSSSDSQTPGPPLATSVTPDTMLNAYYSSSSSEDPSIPGQRTATPPTAPAPTRNSRRISILRRPPRLDMDAVRAAEARGSLTSLPDLIRRATRLAASLEKGRRPASQFQEDDFPNWGRQEKHQSGLSDMLAAFPPPAQAQAPPITGPQTRRSIRDSLREQVQSWPLPLNVNRTLNTSQEAVSPSDRDQLEKSKRRLCCGLPRWMVIVASIIALLIIVAAVVVPIEFFVIRKQENNNSAQQQLQQCRDQLPCANGGTNVIGDDGVCTCRCINGFSGPDCTTFGDPSCTTIALTGSGADSQVTIGNAIPRLVQGAQTNYSIPLSANEIISKFETNNLSCSAENALVTFDGRAIRQTDASSPQQVQQAALGDPDAANAVVIVDGILFTTITVIVSPSTTITLGGDPTTTTTTTTTVTSSTSSRNLNTTTLTLITSSASATATRSIITTTTMSSFTPTPTGAPSDIDLFTVSEDTLDFARVAVLYVLQQDGLNGAETAQVAMQRVFNNAESAAAGGNGVTVGAARNVTIGEGRSVDLVGFFVDLGDGRGRVGGGSGASSSAGRLVRGRRSRRRRRRRRSMVGDGVDGGLS